MTRVNFAIATLTPVIMASALTVVLSTFESRELTDDLQSSRDEFEQLGFEQEQLRLDRSTWAAQPRVDSVARRQLSMVSLSRVEVIEVPRSRLAAEIGAVGTVGASK